MHLSGLVRVEHSEHIDASDSLHIDQAVVEGEGAIIRDLLSDAYVHMRIVVHHSDVGRWVGPSSFTGASSWQLCEHRSGGHHSISRLQGRALADAGEHVH